MNDWEFSGIQTHWDYCGMHTREEMQEWRNYWTMHDHDTMIEKWGQRYVCWKKRAKAVLA